MGEHAYMTNNYELSSARPSDQVAENLTLNFTPIKQTYRPNDTTQRDGSHDKWIPILGW